MKNKCMVFVAILGFALGLSAETLGTATSASYAETMRVSILGLADLKLTL